MRSTRIVTSFVTNQKKILIVKRSERVRSMKGLWGAVSGIIEGNELPLDRAKIEIFEEVGIKSESIELLKAGKDIMVSSPQYPNHEWHIFPFLFKTNIVNITLNWENSSYRWINPNEINQYSTVPNLDEVLLHLL
ncbi:MAG TPA: NUDIX domain-containing protein [Candidatus Nitrosotenuis sp.]|jgi:8-oxo-dGTP pyrophosphatase MutT (NUDIX family)|nr:NUDIX domain-containing protein [Candidatus Nitrosotenuis sp.]HIH45666.1 NUDIX domain-containing protein [Candidatus Nitrosotenuis sp.]HIH68245.1 NUDIX domain-containing protein [Candidatus Nitrosotenuis sp.]HII03612.1 NUDIX domain-containing protein [Candidatus Nitrosotenuis sp.]